MKRRRTRGTTILELMFIVAFLFLICGFVADALVQTSRIANITGAQYDMQRQGHHELDVMINDVHDSQLVLSSYTINGATYTSDSTTTMVLQAPAFDTTGNPLGTDDYIIYHLVGTVAPFELCRVVVPSPGSARKAVNNAVVIENAFSMAITYYADDDIIGDGITSIFTLAGTPTTTPVITKNGKALTVKNGDFTFTAPQTVTFSTPPAAPDALDIVYCVNPQVSPSQANAVYVDLKLQQTSEAFQEAAETQTVELATSSVMRNH